MERGKRTLPSAQDSTDKMDLAYGAPGVLQEMFPLQLELDILRTNMATPWVMTARTFAGSTAAVAEAVGYRKPAQFTKY